MDGDEKKKKPPDKKIKLYKERKSKFNLNVGGGGGIMKSYNTTKLFYSSSSF